MKFQETHFEEYINAVNKINIHPKLEKVYSHFPGSIEKLGNIIFYGPSGVGKYSQMLYSIKKYSHSELKYEKKLSLVFNKDVYFFKIRCRKATYLEVMVIKSREDGSCARRRIY